MHRMSIRAGAAGITVDLARRLVAAQFPEWADLPLILVAEWGNVNAMYRLGDGMVVRLPRVEWGLDGLERELRWLPWLAPRLSTPVPEVIGIGEPGEGFPWRWCIFRWLEGRNPVVNPLEAPLALADDLASFIGSLHALDPQGGPPSDQSLALHDKAVREANDALRGIIDAPAVTRTWDACLEADEWAGMPVWLHGDLTPGNILVTGGRLSAVIDFSGTGIGDPAGDLRVAWNLLPRSARERFRRSFAFDDATWSRAKGKALAQAVNHLRFYRESNPVLGRNAREVIREIAEDRETAGRPP